MERGDVNGGNERAGRRSWGTTVDRPPAPTLMGPTFPLHPGCWVGRPPRVLDLWLSPAGSGGGFEAREATCTSCPEGILRVASGGSSGTVGQPSAPGSCLVAWQSSWIWRGQAPGRCTDESMRWNGRTRASISRSPAPGRRVPPWASRLLPQAAALAWAVQCGVGLCVAAATPPSVWREAWTPREPSSTRSAPSKVQVGDGARAGG